MNSESLMKLLTLYVHVVGDQPMCTQLTGITHEDVRGANPLRDVLDAVSNRFQPEGVPCCTWGEDVSVLDKARKSNGLVSPFGRSIDFVCLSRDLCDEGTRGLEDSNGHSGN